jgi:hypothetical protein
MENFSKDWILQGKDFQGLEKLAVKVSGAWKNPSGVSKPWNARTLPVREPPETGRIKPGARRRR